MCLKMKSSKDSKYGALIILVIVSPILIFIICFIPTKVLVYLSHKIKLRENFWTSWLDKLYELDNCPDN